MPQINKVRIVNFSYNNGKRIIPDTVFSFADGEGNALNTLLSLTNGGGKSILVQLMLQPVLPKAQLAGRKIESYFEKSSDHCFILLEWKLDDSTQRLMTGIAMAAGESRLQEDEASESVRGRTVRWYTFCKEYNSFGDLYDLEQMELSQKQGHRFVAQPFDTVRELAKKRSTGLQYFSAEKQLEYRELLSSYGISQTEWKNTMVRVNETEGGMVKYFEGFPTGKVLVDRLLIPSVEEGLAAARPLGEDTTLSTMLLNYANDYKNSAKQAALRDEMTQFRDALLTRKPAIEDLFMLDDALEKTVAHLHGFEAALRQRHYDLTRELAQLSKQEDDCTEAERQLGWERTSADYYKAERLCEEATAALAAANEQVSRLEQEESSLKREKDCLDSARIAWKIRECKADIAVLDLNIRKVQGDDDTQKHLAQLRYSVLQQANSQQQSLQEKLQALQTQKAELNAAVQECTAAKDGLKQKLENAKAECSRCEGILATQKQQAEKSADRLGIELVWQIDGAVEESPVLVARKAKEDRAAQCEALQEEYTKKRKAVTLEETALREQENTLREEFRALDAEKKDVERELQAYLNTEAELRPVFDRHSLLFSERFTERPRRELSEKIEENDDENSRYKQKESALVEQLEAIQQGSLHLPETVIQFLKSSHVPFQTCEEYLKNCALSAEQVCDLLEKYPACAYGVILSDEDAARLAKEARADWLPTMVPIYQYEQLNKMLDGSFVDPTRALAFYAKDYFADTQRYTQKLEQQKAELGQKLEQLQRQGKQLRDDLNLVMQFPYAENWKKQQRDTVASLEGRLEQTGEKLAQNLQEQKSCREESEQMEQESHARELEKMTLRQWLQNVEDLTALLAKYAETLGAWQQALNNRRTVEAHTRQKESEYQDLTAEQENCQSELHDRQERSEQIRHYQEMVSDATPSVLLEEELDVLYRELEQITRVQSGEIQSLNNQKQSKVNDLADLQKDLDRIGLPTEDYAETIYSDAAWENVEASRQKNRAQQAQAQQVYSSADRAEAVARNAKSDKWKEVLAFGEAPLPAEEISGNFDSRKEEMDKQKRTIREKKSAANTLLPELKSLMQSCARETKAWPCNEPAKTDLTENVTNQFSVLQNERDNANRAFKQKQVAFVKDLSRLEKEFGDQPEFAGILGSAAELAQRPRGKGDRYFSLSEQVDAHLLTLEKRISQIETDLQSLDSDRDEVVSHCVRQGENVYEQLKLLAESSRVRFKGRSAPIAMLKLDLPEEVDRTAAATRIKAELRQGVEELLTLLQNEESTAALRQRAEKLVGNRNLLNKYTGQDNITVQVYKIDLNMGNSRYRTWEETLVKNSGGERFVVYFAVLVTLMNYSRSEGIKKHQSKKGSVLVLDNPFGPITSAHLLGPMFDIARAFRVQLICLSDISKCDITQCFDNIIKILIKPVPLSNIEVLAAENSAHPEQMEHGFFRNEQISLF